MGGLRREEKTREVSQIPILGEVPLLGLFFRSTNTITNRAELVVLLSPHICQDETLPPAVAAEVDRVRAMSLVSARVDGQMETGGPEKTENGTDP